MPPALLTAIAVLLEGVSRKDLAVRAAKLSAAYRQGGTSAVIASQADALAYLVARMPATYAAIRAVFARVTESVPEFAPQACWMWARGRAPRLGRRVRYVAVASPSQWWSPMRCFARWRGKADAGPLTRSICGRAWTPKSRTADLVMAGYVLAELPRRRRPQRMPRHYGHAAAQMLVLVEPGTPQASPVSVPRGRH